MPYDPELHHRRSIRLPGYDYAGNATYFVTICTEGRELLFGRIVDGGMAMNEFGWIAWEEWERSAEIRKEIELGAFVVMPNHLHGIVTIVPDEFEGEYGGTPATDGGGPGIPSRAHGRAPLRRQPRSLGSFVAGFKAAATKRINAVRGVSGLPVWQRNYHDRIIRDERMMERVWSYVETNPLRWAMDRDNPERAGENTIEEWMYPADRGIERRS